MYSYEGTATILEKGPFLKERKHANSLGTGRDSENRHAKTLGTGDIDYVDVRIPRERNSYIETGRIANKNADENIESRREILRLTYTREGF